MNHRWLRAALAALSVAAFCTAAAAQSSVTIYGLADMGVDYLKFGSASTTRLISGGWAGSRLGFRGVEDLGGGLRAQFTLESGYSLDTGTLGQGGRGFGRESSVGLGSSSVGTVVLGRLPTPYYMVSRSVDAFGWMGNGGLLSATRGAGAAVLQPLEVNARTDNSVRYDSPVWGGFQARALVGASEGSTVTGRAYSISGRYASGPLDLVAGWMRQEGSRTVGTAGGLEGTIFGGSYDFGPAQVFAGFNREKNDCRTCTGVLARGTGVTQADLRLISLGVRVPIGVLTLIAQGTMIKDRSTYARDPGDRDAVWWAIGAEYDLSKRTKLWTSLGTVSNRNGSQYALGTGTVPPPASILAPNDPRAKAISAGVRLLF